MTDAEVEQTRPDPRKLGQAIKVVNKTCRRAIENGDSMVMVSTEYLTLLIIAASLFAGDKRGP